MSNSWRSPRVPKGRRWRKNTLVVGPSQPVDGDSVSCTKALLTYLRKRGKVAYTLPTVVMYSQLAWILEATDFHPASVGGTLFTTEDVQAAYDALIKVWRPDEVVLVDGPLSQLGFDTRGIKVFVIDHHLVGGKTQDDASGYIQVAPSAGCLLIERFRILDPILAVSILTDTYWFRQNMPAQAARYLAALVKAGLTDSMLAEMQEKLMVRKDSAILSALHESDLRIAGDTVFAVLKTDIAELHRGIMGEFGYFARHICCIRADGYVSFKTMDRALDLRPLATKYGGGGHPTIAAGHLAKVDVEVIEALFHDFRETVAKSH